MSCSKSDVVPADKNITVHGSVINEIKQPGSQQQYWKAGIIFNKAVTATGTAVVTWYFPAGWINGNSTNRYSQTINFTLNGNGNGYYEFTNWKCDYTMRADSVKVSSFTLTSGDYNVTIK